MTFSPFAPVPLLTAALPGIGGRIKERLEDFEVEEIPAYEPSGTGDHLYLWIEKRGMGADYFLRQLAQRLGVSRADIGTAGLKDRHAITRQWVSTPMTATDQVAQLEGDGIRVLAMSRHVNKLRPGHLRGNRFRILVRGASAPAGSLLQPLLDLLRANGLPNYYGPQRFGRDYETARAGLAMLAGQPVPGAIKRNPFLRKLALSAAQATLFNQYLAQRLGDGLLRRVLAGDVMGKWPAGGMFRAEDPEVEQVRLDAREIVSMGPIFGRKMFPAAAEAAVREATILGAAGLTPESFQGFGKLLQGTRRHNLIYVDDLTAALEPDGVRLAFSLPAGSYATVLLQEVMKTAVADPEGEPEEDAVG